MHDDKARRFIEHELDTTIFVDAGAGSGKTRELVERIVRLVAEGKAALTSIAAITFTDAAAAELRDRVRLGLRLASEKQEQFSDLSDEQSGRCKDALEKSIDSAPIQTLHSFAQRILSLYPLEAGLPPRIEPMDEVEASLAFSREWTRFRDRLYADGCGDPAVADALRRAIALGLQDKQLRKVAEQLHRSWHRLRDWEPEAARMELDLRELLACGDRAFAVGGGVTREDLAAQELDRKRPIFDRLRALDAECRGPEPSARAAARDRLMRYLAELGKDGIRLSGRGGQKANWGSEEALREMKDSLQAAQDERNRLLASLRQDCLTTLLGPLRRFVLDYAEQRRRSGKLEFHDLLVMARDLLAGSREVRGAVGRRYQYLLIDEFQDTDPLQIEIAVLIAGWRDPRTNWREIAVPPGRLFFVGDPKQSIYRFRSADIALYAKAMERFGNEAGVRADLTKNFRSGEPVIHFANEAIGRLFREDRPETPLGGAIQAQFQELEPTRSEPELGGRSQVRVFGGPFDGNANDWRSAEAWDTAAAIVEIIANHERVFDKDAEVWRDARLSDIAILIPSRASLPALERELARAGIPSRIEAKSLLFGTQEVRDLLNVLAAIDDPTNQVAVAAALRTPGFACSDRDLFEWRKALWTPPGRERPVERGWDYTYDELVDAECPPEAARVKRAMEQLRAFHAARWWLTPSELVERVVRELRLMQTGFASRRPRDWWQRIRFVQDRARNFSEAGGRSLRDFVQWMRDQEREDARAIESAVVQSDDDAVRIMTIHAAKGLEFNVVFVIGAGTAGRRQPNEVLWRPDGAAGAPPIEVRVGNTDYAFATAGFEDLAAHEKAMERLERDRLLYVAVTRARDLLFVSAYFKQTGEHDKRHANYECSLAECLSSVLPECPGAWEELKAGAPGRMPPPAPPEPFDDSAEDYARWRARRAGLVRDLGRLPTTSATALAKVAGAPPEEPGADAVEREEPPWRRGRAGTSIGRAVHAVLQTIDLESGEGVEAAAEAQAAAEGLPDRAGEIAEHVQHALKTATVRAAVASGRFWREVPVGVVTEGGMILEGFIDLLYEEPGGLVIADYKTDAVRSAEEAAARAESYRLQGGAYALALTRALGRPVARMVFLFLGPGGNVYELPIENLGEAMEAAQSAATALTAAASA